MMALCLSTCIGILALAALRYAAASRAAALVPVRATVRRRLRGA